MRRDGARPRRADRGVAPREDARHALDRVAALLRIDAQRVKVIAKKGMNVLSQQLEGKAYRDFVAPHLETQLRLYVDVGYAAFAAK